MAKNKPAYWAVGLIVVIAVIAAAGVLGLQFATQELKHRVEQALGPEAEIGAIAVGWSAIEVSGLRIRGPKGWPASDTLRAQRIVIVPDLRALLSAEVRVSSITVEQAYLSVLRARDGRLRLMPSLIEGRAKESKPTAPAPRVAIGAIELREGVLELFDATVREPAHKLRLERLQATIENLHLPELSGHTQIQLDGMIKGVQRNGTLAVRGWAEISSKDSEISARLHGVDLIAFEPYLVKAQETGVGRGALDLDLKSTVRKNVLRAPGTITLSDVELVSRGGTFNTFMGMPRSAFIAALKNRNGQITVKFALEGNLDDPKFSLNESFARRVASSVGETLGVSVEGLARGVGSAARGVGEAVMKLFGK
ncbi:MAG: DUF748 domain-containing protein [Betaproteobacteria bacterium]|nr:DUF748 domain-containing protein [Betaproteobacteria bacterium]